MKGRSSHQELGSTRNLIGPFEKNFSRDKSGVFLIYDPYLQTFPGEQLRLYVSSDFCVQISQEVAPKNELFNLKGKGNKSRRIRKVFIYYTGSFCLLVLAQRNKKGLEDTIKVRYKPPVYKGTVGRIQNIEMEGGGDAG